MPSNRIGEEQSDEAQGKKGCCFSDENSNFIFLKISGIIAVVAVVVLIIILPVYFVVIDGKVEDQDVVTAPDAERFDCYPEGSPSQDKCEARGCTWSPSDTVGAPSCIFRGMSSYVVRGDSTDNNAGIATMLERSDDAPAHYGQQFERLTVETTYISADTVRIKISPDVDRFEVPIEHPTAIDKPGDAVYTVEHVREGGNFGVRVGRKSPPTIVFDTSIGVLMFSEQFLQISTKVASEYIYGFGEHMHENFKHNMQKWNKYGMFSRDQWVAPNVNLYGVHPYFMCMEGDGNAYGVFFVNSNAMEVELQPTPAITYRSVGGVLDFYVFLGPSPEQVTAQYTAVIGRPYFPPYWSLGFQLCRYGYENLENLTRVVDRNLAAGIPYDVQYSDIDYMERQLDFTIDAGSYKGLEGFVKDLKVNEKMRYIIILDPAISGNETSGTYPPFDNGVRDDVFIKTQGGDIAWGKVWPDLPGVTVNTSKDWEYQTNNYRAYAAFPDFYHPNASKWWTDLTVEFHDRIEFDGLWIDMNEPASFVAGSPNDGCPDSLYEKPPYHPKIEGDNLYDKTLCMQSKQYLPKSPAETEHYNLHSLYGLSETLPTLDACRASTGERCIVISRSTYPGSGKYSGHCLGDNDSKWNHLAHSIVGMLEFNLFGIPYVGADVCGFFSDATYELCLRWMQLGAFYPFDRNHNGLGNADQDPASFNQTFIDASKKVLETRYTLLPYLYTLFYDAHKTGSTVVRPLMNEFPNDIETYTIDVQFLWGPALLISPALFEGQYLVTAYFPGARWYHYESGTELPLAEGYALLTTPLDHINLHVRGGYVIPTQEPARTTFYSRQNPLGLIVALDGESRASGKLFWDDGISIDTVEESKYTLLMFTCESSALNINVSTPAPPSLDVSGLHFSTIAIFGVSGDAISSVAVDGEVGEEGSGGGASFNATFANHKLEISGLRLSVNSAHTITWS